MRARPSGAWACPLPTIPLKDFLAGLDDTGRNRGWSHAGTAVPAPGRERGCITSGEQDAIHITASYSSSYPAKGVSVTLRYARAGVTRWRG